MLVFIDESGDPGFKVDQGASPIFIAAMVIFATQADALATQIAIEDSAARRTHRGEFKFSKCSADVRDQFFGAVRSCPFRVRAIVVRKDAIYSARLRSNKDTFYEYFVKQMLDHDHGALKDARIIIDGSGDREFRQNLNSQLRRRMGPGRIKDVRFKDSAADVLVQLTDMCAGAIGHSVRKDRSEPNRWHAMIGQHVDNLWYFR